MDETGDGRQGPSQRVTVLESRVKASFLWFEKLLKISGLEARVGSERKGCLGLWFHWGGQWSSSLS